MKRSDSNIALIRQFFNTEPHARQVSLAEFQALPKEDREELGNLIRETLPVEE